MISLPNATNDEGMQQLASQLHARLSGLYFSGFTNSEVCTVCALVWTHMLMQMLSRMFAAENLDPVLKRGAPALQEQELSEELDLKVSSNRLTDIGTTALLHALAAADSSTRPTLEHLHLNRHPSIGVGTAVALAAAPLHSLSKLSMTRGGAQQ